MSASDSELLRRLAIAVEMRAGGKSWEAVAARLGRSPETCRRWPAHFRTEWNALYRRAERRQMSEARAEATAVLRNQLRLEDTKEKRDAAKALLAAASRVRPSKRRSSDTDVARHIGALSDAEAKDVKAASDRLLGSDAAD